jgi:protein ImuA
MSSQKADIIARLQKEIMPLQGLTPLRKSAVLNKAIGPLKNAFPNNSFPLGAIHEFIANGMEKAAATSGFIAALLSKMVRIKGSIIWITSARTIFPPALAAYGISPQQVIFIEPPRSKDVASLMEEALKCTGLGAVVAETPELSFLISRRLQLAVEESAVTGFVIRINPRQLSPTACVTRWEISPLPSLNEDGLPGVGFARWEINLLKVRNGSPDKWELEWSNGQLRYKSREAIITTLPQRKTG